jgi:hypothetical protein
MLRLPWFSPLYEALGSLSVGDHVRRGAGNPRRSTVFMPADMAIDAIVIVAIMISAFIFANILTAINGDWRSQRRARSAQRQRLAATGLGPR